MTELFPTPWSPKNTILSLMQFLFVVDEDILIILLAMKSFIAFMNKKDLSQNKSLLNSTKFFDYNHYMNQSVFTCVNCQIHFEAEIQYKEHYKSQHHRYNVKRKLIGLVPLSFNDYILQFQTELSSKSQSQSEIYCEVCSKKFMSPQTYKQHINSQKHKQNRKLLLNNSKKDKSQTSSISQFEVIGAEASKQQCLFCFSKKSQKHLESNHSFPPFKTQCINLEGLINFVAQIIKKGQCIYCELQFSSQQSVKQHMNDVGHNKLDIENFGPFQQFYLWKINESSQQQEEATQQIEELKDDQSDFSVLNQPTLQSIQEKRMKKIKYTTTGVIINGKEVGYRAYRNYYKQYLNRNIEPSPRENQNAIQYTADWGQLKAIKPKPQFQRIIFNRNHR